jgi:hypothetical protein
MEHENGRLAAPSGGFTPATTPAAPRQRQDRQQDQQRWQAAPSI